MKIGVFDSGVGGKSVMLAIQKALPDVEVIYENDPENVPYGGKSKNQLLELAIPKIKNLQEAGCDVIVVACNTVTTTIIKEVREEINVPIVAIEPMVKPAASMTKSKKIIICATPATLNSPRYSELVRQHAGGVEIYEPDCSDWAFLIENNSHNQQNIDKAIEKPLKDGADVVVLACTHYHWIEEEIDKVASRYGAKVIQPEQAIIERVKTVLSELA